jgi:ribosomal protein L15E
MKKKYAQACDRLKKKRCDVSYLQNLMVLQRNIEDRKTPSLHKTSEPTALMLGYLFGFLSSLTVKDTARKKTYQEIGFQLGKWIYIVDSIVDVEQDSMAQHFNPILLKCNIPVCRRIKRPSDISRPVKDELKAILSSILNKIKTSLNHVRNP